MGAKRPSFCRQQISTTPGAKRPPFYLFRLFSFSAANWGNLHHLELGHNYWTTKNNHGREAAAFLKGRLLELGNNWELQITTTTGAKRPPF
jgi:hypothetical protein